MAENQLLSYSPKNAIAVIDAIPVPTWNSIEIDLSEDRWNFSAAATGEVTRARNESLLVTCTFTLPQTTAVNKKLSDLTAAQQAVDIGPKPDTFELQIKDLWGNSLHTITECTLTKPPKSTYSKDPDTRIWAFTGLIDKNVIGGN